MHIGLNAHLLSLDGSYRGAGINSYIYHLLLHLGRISTTDRFSVFLGDRRFKDERLDLHYTRWPTHRPSIRILWEQLVQPFVLDQVGVDLLHAMAFVGPIMTSCPFVVTVFDLSFLRYPEAFRPGNRSYLSHFTRWSVRRARRVIAISESTKNDVMELLDVPDHLVDVVYCGVDQQFHSLPDDEVDHFKRQRALPEHFVLFLGTLEPRKNVAHLIRAYAQWQAAEPTAPALVVAGAKGWYYTHVFTAVKELGLSDKVIFPGYIAPEDLAWYYNAADVFVYPSLYEGFGLPVLEAMACATPVITTNVSSLPEVAGNAALLVDTQDESQLAEALDLVWKQADIRREMSANGQAWAATFTWERTAHQTVESYRRALAA